MPDLHERAAASYSMAQEVTKQLITLSTAVFALTLTFAESIAKPGHGCKTLLEISWILYLVSVGFGLVTLMALAGQIVDPEVKQSANGKQQAVDTINTGAIRIPAIIMVLTFGAALVLTTIYGFEAV